MYDKDSVWNCFIKWKAEVGIVNIINGFKPRTVYSAGDGEGRESHIFLTLSSDIFS